MTPFYTKAPALRVPILRADGTEGGYYWTDEWGTPNGPYCAKYADGSTKISGNNRDGVRHGMWTTQSPDGEVISQTQYDQGREVASWRGGQ